MAVPGTAEHLDALSRLFAAHRAYDLASHKSEQLAHHLVAQEGALPPWATRRPGGASLATAHAIKRIPRRNGGLWEEESAPAPPANSPFASKAKGIYSRPASKHPRGKHRARPPQQGRILQSLLPRWYAAHHPRCARCSIPLIPGVSCLTEEKGARCAGCGALSPREHRDRKVVAAVAYPPPTRTPAPPSSRSKGTERIEIPMMDYSVPLPGKPLTIEQKLLAAKAERRARKKALAEGKESPSISPSSSTQPNDTLKPASPIPPPAPPSEPAPMRTLTLDERLKAAKAERKRKAAPSTTGEPIPPAGSNQPPKGAVPGRQAGPSPSAFGTGAQVDKAALRAMLDAKDKPPSEKPLKKPKLGLRALFK